LNNSKASPTIRNCTFISNVTAVINLNGAAPLFENCSFLNNSNSIGSGISSSYSFPVFSNCLFSANYTRARGAPLRSSAAGITIVGSRFENNSSAFDGGAIYLDNGSILGLSRSSFTYNTADDLGGAIGILNSTGQVANCLFAQNQSGFGGGAVMQSGSTVSI